MSEAKSPIDTAPLPWTVGDELKDFAVLDAEGRVVAQVAGRFYNHSEGCRKALEMAIRIVAAVNEAAKKGPTAEDIAICFLGDYQLMKEKGEAAYPEVFFADQIDVYELSNALREAGKDPYIPFPPAVRYLVLNAGFILAKQCGWKGWKAPAEPKELELAPPADSPTTEGTSR